MLRIRTPLFALLLTAALWLAPTRSSAQAPVTDLAAQVNKKLVKLFGAGGFKGLPSYGTGILVSAKGHILTCNNHILTTADLRVHLYDGRFYHARVIYREPELDVALCKIEEEVDFLPHYDFAKEIAGPKAEPGALVFALSNCFQIATRDEPMSIQRGVVAAVAELRGRRGVFEAPFSGEVYFIDTVANNPGSAGGALVDRKGHLLGVMGRELKNTLTDTWINYAVPIHAKVDVVRAGKNLTVDMASFVKEAMAGTYIQSEGSKKKEDRGGYTGIVLVTNAVSNTPPYIEEVVPGSPAAAAGLRPDDLIVYVDGELIPSITSFRELIRAFGPGAEVRLEVQRGTRLESIRLKLAEQPKAK